MTKRKVLVVDDESISRENLTHILTKDGYLIREAEDGQTAISILKEEEIDLVLTDLRMPGTDGMAVLEEAKKLWPAIEVVVITGHASVDTAVEAMRKGAYHYVEKPFKINELRAIVEKALEKSLLRREIRFLRNQVAAHKGVERIVGGSRKMQALRETIAQVSQLDCNVLIQGETGTGKELVAQTLHELSPRSKKRFVAFNCGVFTEELIASELFGYERGAFTGANKSKKGLLEAAEGGTVFFDEVGELSLSLQVKLLRVLQERTLLRVGGSTEIAVDFRVLAATNKDLKREVEAGTFRADLYYRLDVLAINVPSLAERREDIPALTDYFLAKHVPLGRTAPRLSRSAQQRLMAYDYPGNIRELENIAQRLLLFNGEELIEAHHVDTVFGDSTGMAVREHRTEWLTLEEHEKRYILEVLDEVEGNRSAAAKMLGIDRVSLWRKIKRYGLEDPDA
ncbi:MAG: sigma-54-dependent Fis family transcriptional regulator [Desulfobulbus sp.]|nr:sigma-54-dependent Fis family transcriptional regulator [Desulfobulbus sp.]